jgi:hypothetical protein
MNYIQMAIYAGILALGISIGGYTAYTIEHTKVLSAQLQVSDMETRIANQKVEAATILAVETKKVAELEATQIKKNEELDKTHEAFINTSNDYSVKLAAVVEQLRQSESTSGQGSGSTTSEGSSSGINIKDAEIRHDIPVTVVEFVNSKTKIGDEAAIDKNALLDFVVRDNCGIPK